MSAVVDILAKWRAENVSLNPPASQAALARLEAALGVPLPSDIRELYSTADGMPDFEHDPRLLSLWSVQRILRDGTQVTNTPVGTVRELAFCDVLVESYYFVFRVTKYGLVKIGHHLDLGDEEPSLEHFLRRYMDDPESLPAIAAPNP
jgi:hypothetical protein